MDGATIVDLGALGVLIVSAILAYARGFVREVLAIVGWIIAALAAFQFAPLVEPLIREIPYVRDVVANSCQLSILGAFAVVFAIALIVLSIFTPLFASAVQESALGPLDRGAGFLFGVVRGALLIAVALIVYQRMGLSLDAVASSRTVEIMAGISDRVAAEIPTEVPDWAATRFSQLLGACGAPAPTVPIPTAPAITG